ncbi:MAG: hypothetical protein WDM77_10140 [Steroidobacteraceae bacterium]
MRFTASGCANTRKGGIRSHLRATPGFYVNGVVQDVSGGMRALIEAVDEALRTSTVR